MHDRCTDLVVLSRYVHGFSDLDEVVRVERHVRGCGLCRPRLERLRRHALRLFEEFSLPGLEDPGVECPSQTQLERFERGALNERQLVRLQQHVNACGRCRTRRRGREPLLATRAPDVDVHVAVEGVRVATGARHLRRERAIAAGRSGAPPLRGARVSGARHLHFRLRRQAWRIELHLDMRSPEGFAVDVGLLRRGEPADDVVLALWTRTSLVVRRAAARGRWRPHDLLAPGHYFLGESERADPILALSVETGVLGPFELLQAAYDHCRRGALGRLRRSLEEAAAADATLASLIQFVDPAPGLAGWGLPGSPTAAPGAPSPAAAQAQLLRALRRALAAQRVHPGALAIV